MTAKLIDTLDHPAYHESLKFRGYTFRITALLAHTAADAAQVLRKLNPCWTQAEHSALAEQHLRASLKLKEDWSELVNKATLETFGRPYSILDYKISGIAREEFPEPVKESLRFMAQAQTNHLALHRAHLHAARRFHWNAAALAA